MVGVTMRSLTGNVGRASSDDANERKGLKPADVVTVNVG